MEIKQDTISRINEKFCKMSKGQKKIATFIIDHYEQAAFMTAAKLGKKVGTSESTVVRFAYALGYEGYPEFQEDLAEWVKSKLNSVQKMGAKYGKSTQSEILASVLSADIEKIEDTMDQMALYLYMIRDGICLIGSTNTSEMFEQMIRINNKDAVIGISFPRYSMRTLKAMEMANDRNARIITITDSIHSPMCLYSSCNLMARSDMVSIVDSLVAPLSLINALVVALCMKCPEEVKTNLETLEYTWDNYQVYLKDEINFFDEETFLLPLQKKKLEDNRDNLAP